MIKSAIRIKKGTAWRQKRNRFECFKNLKGKSTGNRFLGRPMRRREDNIRMDLKEISLNTRSMIDSVQDRVYWRALVNTILNLCLLQVYFFGVVLDDFCELKITSSLEVKTYHVNLKKLVL